MTDVQSTGPQIEAPNPLEIFWERHRKLVIAGGVLLAAGLAANYGIQYFANQRVNAEWSGFAEVTQLDQGYATDGSQAPMLENLLNNPDLLRFYQQALGGYVNSTRQELVTELPQDLGEVDAGALAAYLQKERGTPREPLLLWVSALHAVEAQDWASAKSHLDQLEANFGDHFLCHQSTYPTQFRAEVPSDDDDEEEEPSTRQEEPELEEPIQGSLVSLLRDRIERETAFRAANRHLYEAATPDPSPVVVMTVDMGGAQSEVRIRFFKDRAPEHVDNFLELVRAGWFDGQKVDWIERQGTQALTGAAEQFHFGLPITRDEQDRSKWEDARGEASEKLLEYEDNNLSHFPGAVAAASEDDGKSSGERVWIVANDAARWFDGERVVFGQVDPADLEKLQDICQMGFMDVDADRTGGGQPQQDATLTFRVEGE